MSPDDYFDLLVNICHRSSAPNPEALPACRWWHTAALEAWEQQRVHLIASADGRELYLASFWLHQPLPVAPSDPFPDGCRWDSGNASRLQFIARPDGDGTLHDHPWVYFRSQVLSGGYTERRPYLGWRTCFEADADAGVILGVTMADCAAEVRRPDTGFITRDGNSQHLVEDVLPETYTLIETGPRVRRWGVHRPGLPWQDHRAFFAERKLAQTESAS